MNIDYKLIGKRIKSERVKRGMTQEKLAEKLDVSIGYVSQVERGITKISLDLLGAISSILECDLAPLVAGCAVGCESYMADELMREIAKLDNRKRNLVLEFVHLLEQA